MIVEAEMILIKNARVMDPESGFDQVTDILLDGNRIIAFGETYLEVGTREELLREYKISLDDLRKEIGD